MILIVGARLQGREGLLAPLGRTCRMGILVELASCQLSIFSGGQDSHPTHINSLIQQYPLLPTPYSLFQD
ncbi:MAG: hypothetical protein F6J99_22370 [Moorea sp. SIO4G3]|nr:hypothetical protein [Moorena sp. SIO4G3]